MEARDGTRTEVVKRWDGSELIEVEASDITSQSDPAEWPYVWPRYEPTEQECEKWRADLQAVCDSILPWLEKMNANA